MSDSQAPHDKLSLSQRVEAARQAVGRTGRLALSTARAGADVAAEQIAKGKEALDDKTRELLNSAYEAQRAEAITNLARLRKKYPRASPSEILGHLDTDLAAVEKKAEVDSDIVIASAALYVLTAIEIHGEAVTDESARQRLIDAIVVVNSKTTKFVAMFGGAALAMVAAGAGKFGKIAGTVAKAGAKLAWLAPLIAVSGIKNPGKKSVAWIVKTVSSRVLGEPPAHWPTPAKAAAKPAAKRAPKAAK